MNSEQDAEPDVVDVDEVDLNTESLQRSRDALEKARAAAGEALKENPPDIDQTESPEPDGEV